MFFAKKEYENILLKMEDVTLKFGSRTILNSVSLEIHPGTITVLTGKSGCGKTTLLGIISGLLRPNKGKVYYKGRNIIGWGDIRKSFFRNRRIGFVFQFFNLLSDFTAFENIILPTTFNLFRRSAGKKVHELIEYLGLTKIKNHYPDTLSGGERQRVAIARAIINNPDIILADEPTGNLDDESAEDIEKLFENLRADGNKALIIVTHDHRIVDSADQHFHLENGDLQLVDHKAKKSAKKTAKKSAKKVSKKATKKTAKKSTAKRTKSAKKSVSKTKTSDTSTSVSKASKEQD